ncbi:hypothetical protein [Nocardia brasiliensis]|uniref:hypothetical protein n=1 Tax=Nocardia brasiliensis TaxID=37326 RepID=UPI00245464E0|nr:hypothetical protein [Nocardia brasiliensis]
MRVDPPSTTSENNSSPSEPEPASPGYPLVAVAMAAGCAVAAYRLTGGDGDAAVTTFSLVLGCFSRRYE